MAQFDHSKVARTSENVILGLFVYLFSLVVIWILGSLIFVTYCEILRWKMIGVETIQTQLSFQCACQTMF